jgi:hypothetical protein
VNVGLPALLRQGIAEEALMNSLSKKIELLANVAILVVALLLGALGVGGTPTLIILDRGGSVVASWVGKPPPGKESEVLQHLPAAESPKAGD